MSNPGDLDPTFGTGGKVISTVTGTGVNFNVGSVLQSDGKIIISSTYGSIDSTTAQFLLARYNTDGSLDTTFGTAGVVRTSFTAPSATSLNAYAVALDSTDRIIVVGIGIPGSESYFAVARYLSDGTLDTTFGVNGYVVTGILTANYAQAIVVQSDNKVIVGGYADDGGDTDFALVRYDTDGSLDATFGIAGKQTTNFDSQNDAVYSLVIQSDGKIIAGGYAEEGGTYNFALARYQTNGDIDTTFGLDGDGKVATSFGTGDWGTSIALQSDDKIIIGGYSVIGSNRAMIARYSADGVLDTTFGTDTVPNRLGV